MANDPQVVTPQTTTTRLSTAVSNNPNLVLYDFNDVIVDYLHDIRDQLVELNRKLDRKIEVPNGK